MGINKSSKISSVVAHFHGCRNSTCIPTGHSLWCSSATVLPNAEDHMTLKRHSAWKSLTAAETYVVIYGFSILFRYVDIAKKSPIQ